MKEASTFVFVYVSVNKRWFSNWIRYQFHSSSEASWNLKQSYTKQNVSVFCFRSSHWGIRINISFLPSIRYQTLLFPVYRDTMIRREAIRFMFYEKTIAGILNEINSTF